MAAFRWALALLVLAIGCRDQPTTPPATVATTSQTAIASAAPRRMPAGVADPPRIALGTQGAVSSAEAHASDVGIAVLQRGGNAVDAAIAVSFALAVTHPSAGNLGGGGFMIVHMADGRRVAIDYRERAPQKAHRDMYVAGAGLSDDRLVGARAAGIPGSVAGMGLAHQRFGKLPWRDVVMPAVALARDGHTLDTFHAADLERAASQMDPDSARHYQRDSGPLAVGARWRQPALAATLLAIADGGADAFYRGALAAKLLAGVERLGGIWQRADLESYRAIARQPVELSYRGHQVLTMPPPSGGGVVLAQLLHAAERFDFAAQPWRDPLSTHRYIEAARRAYADRNSLVADPDHVRVPLAELISREYAQGRMADIGERATDSRTIAAGLAAPESEETTHLSVVDGAGNAVSCTTTLNAGFGAKVVEPATGVLLNNEMDDFTAAPGKPNLYGLVQGEANAIAPGKRMLSSMTPTIVLRDGAPRLLLGSPGGPTITNTVAQILLAVIDHGMTLDTAVAAARLHHQWLPDRVFVEAELAPGLVAALEARGHQVQVRPAIGVANCIEIDPSTGGFRSVADVARDGGKAAAY